MTLADDLNEIAAAMMRGEAIDPARISRAAVDARKMTRALDEIADDAREAADLAEQVAREGIVVPFRGRFW